MRYLILLAVFLLPDLCLALDSTGFSHETGGHIRFYESSSFYGSNHLIKDSGKDDPFLDFSSELRLKSSLFFSDRLSMDIHYEAGFSAGDTRKAISNLNSFSFIQKKSDGKKLFNLTSYRDSSDREYFHRLDRLAIKYSADSASLSIGRQAISTGNGLIFNPMDILNPFAPSDVVRDYKTGTDMAVLQFSKGLISDGTIVYVPGRNEDGKIDPEDSSFAIKMKSFSGDFEKGVFYAKHYNDDVTGISLSGFAGDAAWRSDIIWTKTDSKTEYGYFSSVMNIDYSWTMNNKNWYGLLEFYYSGIGEKKPEDAIRKEELLKRLERGELYNTATKYLGVKIQNEIHPLVNLYLSSIINLDDRSYLVQPGGKWSALENLELLAGADLPFGDENTEFSGIKEPVTGGKTGPPKKFYIQGTWYF